MLNRPALQRENDGDGQGPQDHKGRARQHHSSEDGDRKDAMVEGEDGQLDAPERNIIKMTEDVISLASPLAWAAEQPSRPRHLEEDDELRRRDGRNVSAEAMRRPWTALDERFISSHSDGARTADQAADAHAQRTYLATTIRLLRHAGGPAAREEDAHRGKDNQIIIQRDAVPSRLLDVEPETGRQQHDGHGDDVGASNGPDARIILVSIEIRQLGRSEGSGHGDRQRNVADDRVAIGGSAEYL